MSPETGRKFESKIIESEITPDEKQKKDKYLPIEREHREELEILKKKLKDALEKDNKEEIKRIEYEITETRRQILLYRDVRLMKIAQERKLKGNTK